MPEGVESPVLLHVASPAEDKNVFWLVVSGIAVDVVALGSLVSTQDAGTDFLIRPKCSCSAASNADFVSAPVWVFFDKPLAFCDVLG